MKGGRPRTLALQPAALRRAKGLLHIFPVARDRGTGIKVVGRLLPESHTTVQHDGHKVPPCTRPLRPPQGEEEPPPCA